MLCCVYLTDSCGTSVSRCKCMDRSICCQVVGRGMALDRQHLKNTKDCSSPMTSSPEGVIRVTLAAWTWNLAALRAAWRVAAKLRATGRFWIRTGAPMRAIVRAIAAAVLIVRECMCKRLEALSKGNTVALPSKR